MEHRLSVKIKDNEVPLFWVNKDEMHVAGESENSAAGRYYMGQKVIHILKDQDPEFELEIVMHEIFHAIADEYSNEQLHLSKFSAEEFFVTLMGKAVPEVLYRNPILLEWLSDPYKFNINDYIEEEEFEDPDQQRMFQWGEFEQEVW